MLLLKSDSFPSSKKSLFISPPFHFGAQGRVTLAHGGKWFRPNIEAPQVFIPRLTVKMPIKFRMHPALTCGGKKNTFFLCNSTVPHIFLLLLNYTHKKTKLFTQYTALTMSRTLRFPKEKAMALGGVATGSMKAREEAMVHGSITYSGCTFSAMDWNTYTSIDCLYSVHEVNTFLCNFF